MAEVSTIGLDIAKETCSQGSTTAATTGHLEKLWPLRADLIHFASDVSEAAMSGQPGFFDLSDRYEALSAAGDPLERLSAVVDFEVFRGRWWRRSGAVIAARADGRRSTRC